MSITKYRKDLKMIGRKLRKDMTEAEHKLWSRLRGRQLINLRFNRQKPIGRYVLDFYCAEKRLAIELDGDQHATDEGERCDNERDKFLFKHFSIRTLRFSNFEIYDDLDNVIERIYKEVK